MRDLTGLPLRRAGSNSNCRAAARAASSKPLPAGSTTSAALTLPSASISSASTTSASSCLASAAGGYTACANLTSFGGVTPLLSAAASRASVPTCALASRAPSNASATTPTNRRFDAPNTIKGSDISAHASAQVVQDVDPRDQPEEGRAVADDGDEPAVQQREQRRQRGVALHGHELLGHAVANWAAKGRLVVMDREQHVRLVEDADDLVPLEHGQLRHVVQLHARVGDEQRVVRGDGDDRALLARDHVAQIAVGLATQEALIAHPIVVVHLRK